ncbi:hypothetical protein HA49_20940 [Tatumella morbirosei]|uniref:Uncharacterized protein n=1 Tax=Tatumella morbirosei TaxID=642227 RepID=A0A095V6F2_9GAMM|nr:hypothetical protein HA49_20940 [Tatumella morbirosei]
MEDGQLLVFFCPLVFEPGNFRNLFILTFRSGGLILLSGAPVVEQGFVLTKFTDNRGHTDALIKSQNYIAKFWGMFLTQFLTG